MSYKAKLIAVTACISGNALADSGITLYGVIDTSVRYTTNQATATGPKNQVALSNGGFSGPRWGLRGAEDLGSGSKAIFALESGFAADTGAMSQSGTLFNRQAWIGLSNDTYGTLKAGRQWGATYSVVGELDPIYTGSYNELSWQYVGLTGLRFDNTLDYSKELGGLRLNGQYSFGEQPGKASRGQTFQFGSIYSAGAMTIGGGAIRSTDANGKDATTWTAGAKFVTGAFSFHGYYIDARKDPGFTVGASGTTQPLANTNYGSNANTVAGPNTQTSTRHDRVGVVGVAYQPTASWRLVATYMRDNVAGVSLGASGIIQTGYLVAMYSLSKRTDVYFEADRSWLSGASVTDPNSPIGSFGGASTRTGIGMGLRHKF